VLEEAVIAHVARQIADLAVPVRERGEERAGLRLLDLATALLELDEGSEDRAVLAALVPLLGARPFPSPEARSLTRIWALGSESVEEGLARLISIEAAAAFDSEMVLATR